MLWTAGPGEVDPAMECSGGHVKGQGNSAAGSTVGSGRTVLVPGKVVDETGNVQEAGIVVEEHV